MPNEEAAPNGGTEPNAGTVVEPVDATIVGVNGLDGLLAPNENKGGLVVEVDARLKPLLPNGVAAAVVVGGAAVDAGVELKAPLPNGIVVAAAVDAGVELKVPLPNGIVAAAVELKPPLPNEIVAAVVDVDGTLKPPLPNGMAAAVVVVDAGVKLLGFVVALVVDDTGNETVEVAAVEAGTNGELPNRFEVVLVLIGKDGADVLGVSPNAGAGTDETVDTIGAAAAVVVGGDIAEVLPNVPKDIGAEILGAIVSTEDAVEVVTSVLELVVDTGTKGWNGPLLEKGRFTLIIDVLSNPGAVVPNISEALVVVGGDTIGVTPNAGRVVFVNKDFS